MKRNLILSMVAALAIGAVVAGCGGDDGNDDESSSTGTEAAALTHEEFVAEANQICKSGNAEIDAAGQELQGGPNSPEFESFVTDTLVPNVQGQIDDIRALGIPEEDADQMNAILDEAEQITDEIAADPTVLTSGKDPFASINQQLSEIGLTACAS